ncbi:MAG: hypothetical protein ACK4E8_04575 [Lacibacter sp.]
MRLLPIIMLVFIAAVAVGQDSIRFTPAGTMGANLADMNVDNLGNYYLLSKDNRLKKINNRGDSMGVFNEVRRWGKLYSMDVTNPLKCLLYYRSFSTIVVLDRFMNIVNTIDLRKQNIFQVKAIAQSYDNKIWLYDEQNNKLKRIDDDGSVLMETIDFRQIFDQVPSPVKIVDQEGFVYLFDPEKGVYVFDIYGSFKTRLSYTGLTDFHVFGKTIAGIRGNELLLYTMGTLNERIVALPPGTEKRQKVVFTPGRMYVLVNGVVQAYTF